MLFSAETLANTVVTGVNLLRSAVRTGEVLGLPEIFQDKEPAHRPKAAGTSVPVQEAGGLQSGGEHPGPNRAGDASRTLFVTL